MTTINTPRWGAVETTITFASRTEAFMNGYTEPTGNNKVYGKHIDSYCDENGHGWSKFEWALITEVA